MDIEKLKIRYGYSGKSQQWQYGFDLAIREMQAAKAQAVPESPWVEFGFPELNKDESSDCLTSKEVFFELSNSGGTYHGWYIARPIDKRDQCCCEEEFEDGDVEYEYFFNANVGDELFDEDHISRWMYVPNVKEQSYDKD